MSLTKIVLSGLAAVVIAGSVGYFGGYRDGEKRGYDDAVASVQSLVEIPKEHALAMTSEQFDKAADFSAAASSIVDYLVSHSPSCKLEKGMDCVKAYHQRRQEAQERWIEYLLEQNQ